MKLTLLLSLTIAFYIWEILYPLKKRIFNKDAFSHGLTNLLIVGLSTISLKVFSLLVLYIGFDYFSTGPKLILSLGLSESLSRITCLVLFDFLIWFQHVLSHRVPLFWRFHRVHHCDPFLDTSSALRFHPIEIVASMIYKIFLIYLLGISKEDFLIFEVLLTGFALFNHSNIFIPKRVDQLISLLIITPNVHQVHHSKKVKETNSNYGFNLIIWDKIFKTYNDYYKVKEELEIGLNEVDDSKTNSLSFLLGWPLRRD